MYKRSKSRIKIKDQRKRPKDDRKEKRITNKPKEKKT
jgi:hypothetical protein